MTRRIVVIGNAPIASNIADEVDTAAHVIRFNKARGFAGAAGTRTDQLYLVNHGGQMAEWLDEGSLHRHPVVQVTRTVVLPIPELPGHVSSRRAAAIAAAGDGPVDQDRINHLEAARQVLESTGTCVDAFCETDYRRAQAALVAALPDESDPFPSTGFLALYRTLERVARDDRVELYGFSFQGWSGHRWAAERDWVVAQAAAGRLVVQDPGSRVARDPSHTVRAF